MHGSRGTSFRSRLPLRCLIACIFSWIESDLLRHRMQIANFAKLAACLFPNAREEECLMMSYYHLWVPCLSLSPTLFLTCFLQVFLWDDGINELAHNILSII